MARPFITTTVTGDSEVVSRLNAMSPKVKQELLVTVRRLAIGLQGHVKQNKLSGQVLKNRTGTLRRSITYKVTEGPDGVRAQVGTNVAYARPHEFGYQGKALIDQAFGRKLKFPVWKSINLPERSFLRSSLKDKAEQIKTELRQAVLRGTV